MTGDSGDGDFCDLSAQDMKIWLAREEADVDRAKKLRMAEATNFVEAFAHGEISREEVENRVYEYSCRWGDPLPGVGRSEGMTDKQILSAIKRTRIEQGLLSRERLRKGKTSPPSR